MLSFCQTGFSVGGRFAGVGDGGVTRGGNGLLRLDDRAAGGAVATLGQAGLSAGGCFAGVGDWGVVGFDDLITLPLCPLCGGGIAGGM